MAWQARCFNASKDCFLNPSRNTSKVSSFEQLSKKSVIHEVAAERIPPQEGKAEGGLKSK
jgi:hypothetical protein